MAANGSTTVNERTQQSRTLSQAGTRHLKAQNIEIKRSQAGHSKQCRWSNGSLVFTN
jgi:hypothetical protein